MLFRKRSITYWTGTVLIILSVLLLFAIYSPFIYLFLFPHKIASVPHKGTYIMIPKIGAFAPIISNVNPWNEGEYREKLKLGVAAARGFAAPGQQGTIFLFAHSSDYPWNITRYNTAFFRLGELSKGDVITLYVNGKPASYKVYAIKVVWPQEVQYVKNSMRRELILQTCTPIGTDFQRLLLFAKPA